VLAAASVAASPTANVRSEEANHVVSRPGRLRTSQIPKVLLVRWAVTPPCNEMREGQYASGLSSRTGSHISRLNQNYFIPVTRTLYLVRLIEKYFPIQLESLRAHDSPEAPFSLVTLLAIICLHCLPRLASFSKTDINFVRGN